VLRLRANLFFGNVSAFREEFYASVIESQDMIKYVVVNAWVWSMKGRTIWRGEDRWEALFFVRYLYDSHGR
jgi:hypothetical protein